MGADGRENILANILTKLCQRWYVGNNDMDEEEEIRSFVTKAEENLQTVDKVSELVQEKSVDKLDSPLLSKK